MICLYIQFFLTIFLLILPGILLSNIYYSQLALSDRSSYGVILGLGLSIYLAFVCSYFSLDLFWFSYLAIFIVLLIYSFQTKRIKIEFKPISKEAWLLGFLLLVVLGSRMLASWFHSLPLGWDPSFHLILARKILESNQMIFDWRPFEQIDLNYPVGSHLLVVLISSLSKLELPQSFSFLFPLIGALTTLQVYIFTKQISKCSSQAIYAAIAYGLWAIYGSIDYVRWGGLPNLLGMSFFMQSLIILTANRYKLIDVLFFALSFSSMVFTHHHVSITAAFIMLAIIISLLMVKDYQRLRFLCSGLFLSLLLTSFYILPYAKKSLTLGSTGILKYREVFFNLKLIIISVGEVFFFATVLGCLAIFFVKKLRKMDVIFYAALYSLIFLFIFFEYLYRIYAVLYLDGNFVAFTPSRFLTDFTYFACVLIAIPLAWIEKTIQSSRARVYLLSFAFLLSFSNFTTWKNIIQSPTPSQGEMSALIWIDKNLPKEVLVLNKAPWSTYLSWRKTLSTPVPISEPLILTTDKATDSQVVFVSKEAGSKFEYKTLWKDTDSSWEVRQVIK